MDGIVEETVPIPIGIPLTPARGVGVIWKYRAIYLEGDNLFGPWSDVASLAVTG